MIKSYSIFNSFRFATSGVLHAIKYNRNLRVHFAVAVFVIFYAIFLNLSLFEKIALGIMIVLVISAEMINTSIEEMTNLITREHRAEAKIAKDVSAGMVLVVSAGSVIIGILIFLPHVLGLIGI